jgi:hypothetical protein
MYVIMCGIVYSRAFFSLTSLLFNIYSADFLRHSLPFSHHLFSHSNNSCMRSSQLILCKYLLIPLAFCVQPSVLAYRTIHFVIVGYCVMDRFVWD